MITPKQASQFGFVVESLMAIVVVAILMTAITSNHPLGCNSVQARRVELATLPPKLTLMVSGLGRLLLQAQFNSLKVSISESVAALIARQTSSKCTALI